MTEKLTEKITKRAEDMTEKEKPVKLTKNMSIADMIKALEPEIKRALPSVMTPERFTRMALSSLNTTPKLAECTPMSFIASLMDAAQLGLEPNTPLGQAYLIPYRRKERLECQFQIGYRGMLDLAYRNERVRSIEAHTVYENDDFYFELGLDAKLRHVPAWEDRGEIKGFYAVYRLDNGGYRFEVMSKADIDIFAGTYSKSLDSASSPWRTNYEEMAKKTVIKRLLKYAPLKSDFRKALSLDGTVKTELSPDMSEVISGETEYVPGEFTERTEGET